jgi:hypothetical protein
VATTYGPLDQNNLCSQPDCVSDAVGHHHLPAYSVLKTAAETFKNAPVPIAVHFDVGANYQDKLADGYIIPSAGGLARGGELIKEKKCVDQQGTTCMFEDFPGTVTWKNGFQFLRDAPVNPSGGEISASAQEACFSGLNPCPFDGPAPNFRRRFDLTRDGLFHYALFAHGTGQSNDPNPCLDSNGPKPANSNGTCNENEYNTHLVPNSRSGVGDFGGGSLMVTLGFWGNAFRGPEFVQTSTFVHELGHNLWLTHRGNLQYDSFLNLLTPLESNCNPNYPSVMSYLYQVPGQIVGANNVPHRALLRGS